MPAIVGNAAQGYGGLHLGAGPNGPVAIFFGTANPNNLTDTLGTVNDPSVGPVVISGTDRITAARADIGSLYIQAGVGHWQKTAMPNTWVQVSVP